MGLRSLICALFLGLSGGLAFAQATLEGDVQTNGFGPGAVLTLDPERLYQRSEYALAARKELEGLQEALRAENERIRLELTEEERSLTERRPRTNPAEFGLLAAEFDSRVTRIRLEQDKKLDAIRRLPVAERARFFDLVRPILLDMVEELKAVAILNSSAVIIASSSIDITDEAISRINAVLGDIPRIQIPSSDIPQPPEPEN